MSIDRETLGALVRQVWVEKAQELPNPKPSNLLPWEQLDEWNKEVDRCIGERIAAHVFKHIASVVLDQGKEG